MKIVKSLFLNLIYLSLARDEITSIPCRFSRQMNRLHVVSIALQQIRLHFLFISRAFEWKVCSKLLLFEWARRACNDEKGARWKGLEYEGQKKNMTSWVTESFFSSYYSECSEINIVKERKNAYSYILRLSSLLASSRIRLSCSTKQITSFTFSFGNRRTRKEQKVIIILVSILSAKSSSFSCAIDSDREERYAH